MTRQIGKSAKFSAIVAILVLMVMGIDSVFAENQAQLDLHEFGELLDGIEAELLTTQGQIAPVSDTSQTIHTEFIQSQISYLEAFEEVIHRQIL